MTKAREITNALRAAAVQAAEAAGYSVERQTGVGRGPNQRLLLTKDGQTRTAALRTSRDMWVAFAPDGDGGWNTLGDVDLVLLAMVDNVDTQTTGTVWLLDAADLLPRFNLMAETMTDRGQELQPGMGVWIHANKLPKSNRYAAGSGMVEGVKPLVSGVELIPGSTPELSHASPNDVSPLDQAIAALADELGVEPSRISISISGS